MGRLLVSVRGSNEAIAAAEGGAHIVDVEYPTSALGTPYPLNIRAVRERLDGAGYASIPLSTNIGEEQASRSTACQAALGVATAGADYVKCGFASLNVAAASYLGDMIVRTVRLWHPEKKIVPAVFPEREFVRFLDPLNEGPTLTSEIGADGLLIDTFAKHVGKGLFDYYATDAIRAWVSELHSRGKEAWIAGSISKEELPAAWATGADVVCVRRAACTQGGGTGRFGAVSSDVVAELVATKPLEDHDVHQPC